MKITNNIDIILWLLIVIYKDINICSISKMLL